MRPKEYPSTHKELWQRFVRLESKPRPYEEEDCTGVLFWSIVCAVVFLLVMLAWWEWFGPEPLDKIFPGIIG